MRRIDRQQRFIDFIEENVGVAGFERYTESPCSMVISLPTSGTLPKFDDGMNSLLKIERIVPSGAFEEALGRRKWSVSELRRRMATEAS
jgi:hypothetical protein